MNPGPVCQALIWPAYAVWRAGHWLGIPVLPGAILNGWCYLLRPVLRELAKRGF